VRSDVVREVVCPRCGAAVGDPCLVHDGTDPPVYRRGYRNHPERVRLRKLVRLFNVPAIRRIRSGPTVSTYLQIARDSRTR
jgi:hypothetical protein